MNINETFTSPQKAFMPYFYSNVLIVQIIYIYIIKFAFNIPAENYYSNLRYVFIYNIRYSFIILEKNS